MYSDMSRLIRAVSSPKRNSASVLASSVLPTPDGPRKMNEPDGRLGSLRPARVRRTAWDTALMESSWRSEEHTSELQSLMRISYAVFCLKKKKKHQRTRIKRENNAITHQT